MDVSCERAWFMRTYFPFPSPAKLSLSYRSPILLCSPHIMSTYCEDSFPPHTKAMLCSMVFSHYTEVGFTNTNRVNKKVCCNTRIFCFFTSLFLKNIFSEKFFFSFKQPKFISFLAVIVTVLFLYNTQFISIKNYNNFDAIQNHQLFLPNCLTIKAQFPFPCKT